MSRVGVPEHLGDVPRHVEPLVQVTSRPPREVPRALPASIPRTRTAAMHSVPTDLGRAGFLGPREGPSQLGSRLERSTPGRAQTSAPPTASAPHLLPRQRRPPTPGHLGGEGGGPGRGVEVLGGDCQELGDAELLGHGGRWAGARGCWSSARGSLRCTALCRPHSPQRSPSGPPRAPPIPAHPRPPNASAPPPGSLSPPPWHRPQSVSRPSCPTPEGSQGSCLTPRPRPTSPNPEDPAPS